MRVHRGICSWKAKQVGTVQKFSIRFVRCKLQRSHVGVDRKRRWSAADHAAFESMRKAFDSAVWRNHKDWEGERWSQCLQVASWRQGTRSISHVILWKVHPRSKAEAGLAVIAAAEERPFFMPSAENCLGLKVMALSIFGPTWNVRNGWEQINVEGSGCILDRPRQIVQGPRGGSKVRLIAMVMFQLLLHQQERALICLWGFRCLKVLLRSCSLPGRRNSGQARISKGWRKRTSLQDGNHRLWPYI